jgi:hypothetical protein
MGQNYSWQVNSWSVKIFTALYETQMFNTVYTRARFVSLFGTKYFHFILSHLLSLRITFILTPSTPTFSNWSLSFRFYDNNYEGESINSSQMGIKRKTCDIRTWKKTCIPRHILRQHSYTCPIALIQVFWLLSQPHPHLRFNLFVISETFATQLWTALREKYFPP